MSETFYTSCADVLALCQAEKDNLEALLDAQTGFAPRLRQLCEQQCVPHSRLPHCLVHSFFTDCQTFEKRETRRKRRLRRYEWNAVHGLFSKQSCRASSCVLSTVPTNPPLPPLTQSFFPAPEKQNPHPNLRRALFCPRTRTPRPPSSPRRRWPPRERYRSSSSCANGSTRLHHRHHAQTRRQVIGALRSTA